MNHKWVADDVQPNPDSYRNYSCDRCGSGPVRIPVMESKRQITKRAKAKGIEPECKNQQLKVLLQS